MKNPKSSDNIRLGTFVMAGVLFMVLSLYLIGKNQNLFGSTFTVTASFTNVNGLVAGNNVRFAGIDVGTVKAISVSSDSTVMVQLILNEDIKPFIRSNAIASIGTDGLMGNKLVNINPGAVPGKLLEDGGMLQSQEPVETDEMLRTLKVTNDNIAVITDNLKQISTRLNSSNSLWSILGDTAIAYHLKTGVANFNLAGQNVAELTLSADRAVQKFSNGKGLATALFTDTLLRTKLEESVQNVRSSSSRLDTISADLGKVIRSIKTGKGPAATLLNDSLSSARLRKTFQNIESGTAGFNENMEALKHNFLFRHYFKKLEKQKKDTAHQTTNGHVNKPQ